MRLTSIDTTMDSVDEKTELKESELGSNVRSLKSGIISSTYKYIDFVYVLVNFVWRIEALGNATKFTNFKNQNILVAPIISRITKDLSSRRSSWQIRLVKWSHIIKQKLFQDVYPLNMCLCNFAFNF